jgi:hypothetical protein
MEYMLTYGSVRTLAVVCYIFSFPCCTAHMPFEQRYLQWTFASWHFPDDVVTAEFEDVGEACWREEEGPQSAETTVSRMCPSPHISTNHIRDARKGHQRAETANTKGCEENLELML